MREQVCKVYTTKYYVRTNRVEHLFSILLFSKMEKVIVRKPKCILSVLILPEIIWEVEIRTDNMTIFSLSLCSKDIHTLVNKSRKYDVRKISEDMTLHKKVFLKWYFPSYCRPNILVASSRNGNKYAFRKVINSRYDPEVQDIYRCVKYAARGGFIDILRYVYKLYGETHMEDFIDYILEKNGNLEVINFQEERINYGRSLLSHFIERFPQEAEGIKYTNDYNEYHYELIGNLFGTCKPEEAIRRLNLMTSGSVGIIPDGIIDLTSPSDPKPFMFCVDYMNTNKIRGCYEALRLLSNNGPGSIEVYEFLKENKYECVGIMNTSNMEVIRRMIADGIHLKRVDLSPITNLEDLKEVIHLLGEKLTFNSVMYYKNIILLDYYLSHRTKKQIKEERLELPGLIVLSNQWIVNSMKTYSDWKKYKMCMKMTEILVKYGIHHNMFSLYPPHLRRKYMRETKSHPLLLFLSLFHDHCFPPTLSAMIWLLKQKKGGSDIDHKILKILRGSTGEFFTTSNIKNIIIERINNMDRVYKERLSYILDVERDQIIKKITEKGL